MATESRPAAAKPVTPEIRKEKRKLSYKDQRELEAIPQKIQALEREQADVQARLADPDTYQQAGNDVTAMNRRLEEIEMELLALLERWEALEKAP